MEVFWGVGRRDWFYIANSTTCFFCFLPSLASGLEFLIYAENLAKMSIPAVFDSGCFGESFKYLGGHKTSSRNSSILFTSVLTSLLKVINGGWVPGAKFCRSAGFLYRSTVVKLNTTPLSQRIMKSLWEKGQFPMLSPSLPAWETEMNIKKNVKVMIHKTTDLFLNF